MNAYPMLKSFSTLLNGAETTLNQTTFDSVLTFACRRKDVERLQTFGVVQNLTQ